MTALYVINNSQFYFVRDFSEGKFYVRTKEIGLRLNYNRRTGCKVKKCIRKRYDCKLFFDFKINYTKIPKNSLFLEYDGVMKMIDYAYGTEKDKLKLKTQLDSFLKCLQKLPPVQSNPNYNRPLVLYLIGVGVKPKLSATTEQGNVSTTQNEVNSITQDVESPEIVEDKMRIKPKLSATTVLNIAEELKQRNETQNEVRDQNMQIVNTESPQIFENKIWIRPKLTANTMLKITEELQHKKQFSNSNIEQ